MRASAGPAAGQEHWSQFRGPGGRGIAPDAERLPVEFDQTRNLLWRCPVSGGLSSPCIWGDRIFLTGHAEDRLETICIDRTTGEIAWRRSVEPPALERLQRIHSAATPTPATDGERVYAYFGSFGLICYDLEGEEQWVRELPIQPQSFGTSTSPILADGLLILVRDTNSASFLEAIEPESGCIASLKRTRMVVSTATSSAPSVGTVEITSGVLWMLPP